MEQLMDPMAKMARIELDNDLLMLTQERTMAEATLNRLMAREPGTVLPDPAGPPPPATPDDGDALRRALADRPELHEARHHVAHTLAQRRLAGAGWVPDLMLQHTIVDVRDGAPMYMVMARVNVPFAWFWRQGAEVSAASRMVEQAAVEMDGVERETRTMVATDLAALRTDQARLNRVEHEAVPLAEAALHLGLSGYRAGSVGVADALGTVTAYQAAILEVIALKARIGRGAAALERLTGTTPESSSTKELHHVDH
jgi:outer membrane protein TolC